MSIHGLSADVTPLKIELWPENPPEFITGTNYGDDTQKQKIRNVGIPQITLHFPKNDGENRPVFLICPGGGYRQLARVSTANGALERLLPHGVVVAVLSYRTSPPYGENVDEIALSDAKRAVRLLRANADVWGINPQRIGVIGWSAGGNLTLNLASHADDGNPNSDDIVDRESSYPNVVAILCPWPYKYSIDKYPITDKSPPAFVASAKDDEIAPTSFSISIVNAYQQAQVPVYFWQIDQGGHMAFSETAKGEGKNWDKEFWNWLTSNFMDW